MELRIEGSPYLAGSPNSVAAHAAAAEISQAGIGDYEPSERDEVMVAIEGSTVVGVLVWLPYDDCAFIGVAWVRADRRRCGIYRRMVEELEGVAVARGLRGIRASVDCRNDASLATHTALGIKPQAVLVERMFQQETGTGQ